MNYLMPVNEYKFSIGQKFSFLGSGYLRVKLVDKLALELESGYGKLAGLDDFENYYSTQFIPIDIKLRYYPFNTHSINVGIYAGIGTIYFNVKDKPAHNIEQANNPASGWDLHLPAGIAAEFALNQNVSFDIEMGYNHTSSDNLNFIDNGGANDGFFNVGIGLNFKLIGINPDRDNDGLQNDFEESIGTDPENFDTDGDGLYDGIEVNELKTNPLKYDTDSDGLNDYDELNKYFTDPIKNDTDGDGLFDRDEIFEFGTDPLSSDTDKDGLNDFDEVKKYKTNPLKIDTDGGSVPDNVEVQRGTNPLDPSDDV